VHATDLKINAPGLTVRPDRFYNSKASCMPVNSWLRSPTPPGGSPRSPTPTGDSVVGPTRQAAGGVIAVKKALGKTKSQTWTANSDIASAIDALGSPPRPPGTRPGSSYDSNNNLTAVAIPDRRRGEGR